MRVADVIGIVARDAATLQHEAQQVRPRKAACILRMLRVDHIGQHLDPSAVIEPGR